MTCTHPDEALFAITIGGAGHSGHARCTQCDTSAFITYEDQTLLDNNDQWAQVIREWLQDPTRRQP